jgi:hypothetical protein
MTLLVLLGAAWYALVGLLVLMDLPYRLAESYSGVVRVAPAIERLAPGDPLIRLAIGWPTPEPSARARATDLPASFPLDGLEGRVVAVDCVGEPAECAVLTAQGEQQSRWYFWSDRSGALIPLTLAPGTRQGRPLLVGEAGDRAVLTERWEPWPNDLPGILSRTLRDRGEPARLAEDALVLVDPDDSTSFRYLTPGASAVVSPDRTMVSFVRSRGSSGSHSLHIWHVQEDRVDDLLSMKECDPGSGVSFSLRWSPDSRWLVLEGCIHDVPTAGGTLDVLVPARVLFDTQSEAVFTLATEQDAAP